MKVLIFIVDMAMAAEVRPMLRALEILPQEYFIPKYLTNFEPNLMTDEHLSKTWSCRPDFKRRAALSAPIDLNSS